MSTPIIIVLIIALIAVSAVGGLLATQTWNPEWNPFEEKPGEDAQKMLTKAIEGLLEIDTLEYEGSAGLTMEDNGPQTGQGIFSFSGKIDASDEEKPKGSFNINIDIDSANFAFSGGLEIITFAEDFYLKITSLPELSFLPVDPNMFSGITNNWIKISKQDLEQFGIVQAPEDTEPENVYKEFGSDLVEAMKEHPVFVIEKDLGIDQVKGMSCEHYLVSIDKEALKLLIPEYFNLIKKHGLTENYAMYEQEMEQALEQLPQSIDDLWEKIDGIEFEVWLTEKDSYLARVKFEKEFTYEQKLISDASVPGSISLAADIQLFNFNEPLEIQAPTEYKTIEDVFSSLFGASMLDTSITPEFFPNE